MAQLTTLYEPILLLITLRELLHVERERERETRCGIITAVDYRDAGHTGDRHGIQRVKLARLQEFSAAIGGRRNVSARRKHFYALMAGENNSYGRTPAYLRSVS